MTPTETVPVRPRRSISKVVKQWLREALVDNAALKVVALILSLTVFFLVHTDEPEQRTITLSVSYTTPAGKVLAAEAPNEIRVVVRGSKRVVKRLNESDFEQPSVVLPDMNADFVFQSDMIRLPRGLEFVSVNPQSFPLRLDREIERVVPVEVRMSGEPASGYEVGERSATPNQVKIIGPETLVNQTATIGTGQVIIQRRSSSFEGRMGLVSPSQFVRLTEDHAEVKIKIIAKQGVRVIGQIPVVLAPSPNLSPEATERFAATPATISITLRGPVPAIEAVVDEQIRPTVTVSAADFVPGRHKSPIVMRGLPDGIAVEVKPAEVTLALKPAQ